MRTYELMNNGMLIVCAVLFVLFLWIVIVDAMKPTEMDTRKHYKTSPTARDHKPKVKLELMYPSVLKEETLHIPVKNVFHAQEYVDGLGLKTASVGYRRSSDGQSIILYTLDDARVLRRVQEVV